MSAWILFADPESAALRPLTWLRPCSELLLGTETLEERWRRLVAGEAVRLVVPDVLVPFGSDRSGWGEAQRHDGADVVWVRDCVVPTAETVAALRGLPAGRVALIDGVPVAVRGPLLLSGGPSAALAGSIGAALERMPREGVAVPGLLLRGLGDLVSLQARLLESDLVRHLDTHGPSGPRGTASATMGDGFVYAPDRVSVEATVRIDHGAVLDARNGPIVLGPGCVVHSGTYLRGPLYARERCLFLGGSIGSGSSFGPVCRVRGEVESTVFLGWSNKAHDGFLGHSYVGPWVNLGALTTTSDLRNDYGEVTLLCGGQRIPTGSSKVGTFFGDHAKTRIGCLLDTGTVVGLGANVFGGAPVAERELLDFQWGTGPGARAYRIDKFLAVARVVLDRRGVPWSTEYEQALRWAHAASQAQRAERLGDA